MKDREALTEELRPLVGNVGSVIWDDWAERWIAGNACGERKARAAFRAIQIAAARAENNARREKERASIAREVEIIEQYSDMIDIMPNAGTVQYLAQAGSKKAVIDRMLEQRVLTLSLLANWLERAQKRAVSRGFDHVWYLWANAARRFVARAHVGFEEAPVYKAAAAASDAYINAAVVREMSYSSAEVAANARQAERITAQIVELEFEIEAQKARTDMWVEEEL